MVEAIDRPELAVAALAKLHIRLAALERRMFEMERSTANPQQIHTSMFTDPDAPARILNAVAYYTRVSLAEIHSRSRLPRVSLARHIAMFLLVTDGGLSRKETGRMLGRDRSTVIYAIHSMTPSLRTDIEIIRRRVREGIQ